jgi:hypothetical protein
MKKTALKRKTALKSHSQLKVKKPLSQKKGIIDYCKEKAKKEGHKISQKQAAPRKVIRSSELKKHWETVGDMACIVSGAVGVTLHHCHGGSMKDIGVMPGMAQKSNDWLVLPLAAQYHCIGSEGIDAGKGVLTWEGEYGSQVMMLAKVWEKTGVNIFEKAGCDMERVYAFLSDMGVDVEALAA